MHHHPISLQTISKHSKLATPSQEPFIHIPTNTHTASNQHPTMGIQAINVVERKRVTWQYVLSDQVSTNADPQSDNIAPCLRMRFTQMETCPMTTAILCFWGICIMNMAWLQAHLQRFTLAVINNTSCLFGSTGCSLLER